MSLSIKEAFRVEAPPDLVWEFLLSPTDVVRCLPGADLTDTIDERTFAGRVKVKVGPITTAYVGQARVTEIDAVARRILDRLKARRALRPSADLPPLDLEVHWLVLRAHRGTAGYRNDHCTRRVPDG